MPAVPQLRVSAAVDTSSGSDVSDDEGQRGVNSAESASEDETVRRRAPLAPRYPCLDPATV